MRTIKNVFIFVFPVLLLLVVFNIATGRSVRIRDLSNYFLDQWSLTTDDVRIAYLNLYNSIENFSVDIPNPNDNESTNLLQNIYFYIKLYGSYLLSGFTVLFQLVILLIRVILVPLKCILAFVNTLFFLIQGYVVP